MMLFIDKQNNLYISFEYILKRINGDNYIIYNFCENNVAEFFINFIKSLVFNIDNNLLDLDYSETEISKITPFLGNATINKKEFIRSSSYIRNLDELKNSIINSSSTITFFTSGTTGTPKPVVHTISNLLRGVRIHEKHQSDVWALLYNPTHIAGIQVFLQALLNYNTIHYLFNKEIYYIETELKINTISHISATPTFFKLLLPLKEKNYIVQRITLGGEKSTLALINEIKSNFPNAKITNIYATTETGTLFISNGDTFEVPASIKEKVRINHNLLEIHHSLVGQSQSIMGEWYCTGDYVEIISHQPLVFRILNRDVEEIKIAGNRVSIIEVETVLNLHPDIVISRVYTKKNSITGLILCADIVVSNEKITEHDIINYLNQHLQPFKVPRIIRKVKQIDITKTGKIKRN